MSLDVRGDERRKIQLERDLKIQEDRLSSSSERALAAIKYDLDVLAWLREYPREAAVLAFAAGLALSRVRSPRA